MLIGNSSLREQKIRIGGIGYSISCEDDIRLDESLGPFFISGDTDAVSICRLSIAGRLSKRDFQQEHVQDHVIFATDATWGLYGISKFALAVPPLRKGSHPQLFAVFDEDFTCGTVYIDKAGIDHFLYPFLEVLTIILLGRGNGVLLHSSCVDDNGKGYLFVGRSGAGKSTMANLWNGKQGVKVLSDDRVLVSESDEGFFAYGTPWHGSANYAVNSRVPINKIFFVRHAECNIAAPVSGMKPVSELIKNAFLPFWNKDGMEYSVEFLGQIGQRVDSFDLCFLPVEDVVDYLRSF